jgi:type II secretory pathway component GspD/PulD (secretin)
MEKYRRNLLAMVAMVLITGLSLSTQARAQPEERYHADTYQSIALQHMASNNQALDILQALRNGMPQARVYLNSSAQMLSINASAADVALAQKIVAEMDKPIRTYRLTYTLTQIEDGKRAGPQRFELVVASGERASMKQGTRVPIQTGSYQKDTASKESEIQYLDVGLGIEAKAEGFPDGVKITSKVEESSVGEEHSGFGAEDPVVHQTEWNATAVLPLGKPVVLGSLDVPGTTQRLEVEVTAELVK